MIVADETIDVLWRVRGLVQGVGFRPFVHRAATELRLRGWVRNDQWGVLVRLYGEKSRVDRMLAELRHHAPAAASVDSVVEEFIEADTPPTGDGFAILESPVRTDLPVEVAMPPDLALCADCRAELLDPANRRFRYPFINCTQCGPRYSILEVLPYDRPRTTMRAFRMCPSCQSEYDDPADRRFHAQPNACPACGPAVKLTNPVGDLLGERDIALSAAAVLLRNGAVVAVQGIGGYHLLVDATNEAAVAQLRTRKHREEKPFAVMFRDLDAARAVAEVCASVAAQLESSAAPIVLVPRRADAHPRLAPSVAPGNPWIGALLASTPLHVLLLSELDFPVVATSGNLAEEPLCTSPAEARDRLGGIADAFLEHNRPIAHPVDDAVLRFAECGPVVLRRARGFAPTPLALPAPIEGNWLCVGAQMKNVVGAATADRVVLSPHIGDLAGAATLGVFRRTIDMLAEVRGAPFTAVVCDRHPDYASTRYAQLTGLPCLAVQHHLAHVLACLLEHRHAPDGVLGVAFDGTGYGEDGTIWGGEFILLNGGGAQRFGRLRPFRLAGGEAAVRDSRRVALALLQETSDPRFTAVAHALGVSTDDSAVLRIMLGHGLNSPITTSMGRLFDAVGALLGLGRRNQFEGQVPLAVEAAATAATDEAELTLPVRAVPGGHGAVCEIDWQPMLNRLLAPHDAAAARALAAGFHTALANAVVEVARRAEVGTVALSGGCFQNALLLDRTVTALSRAGLNVLTHRELPPNDGNIAAGQAYAALLGLSSVKLP